MLPVNLTKSNTDVICSMKICIEVVHPHLSRQVFSTKSKCGNLYRKAIGTNDCTGWKTFEARKSDRKHESLFSTLCFKWKQFSTKRLSEVFNYSIHQYQLHLNSVHPFNGSSVQPRVAIKCSLKPLNNR